MRKLKNPQFSIYNFSIILRFVFVLVHWKKREKTAEKLNFPQSKKTEKIEKLIRKLTIFPLTLALFFNVWFIY